MRSGVNRTRTRSRNGRAGRPRYSELAFRTFDMFFRPWRAGRLRTAPIIGLPAGLPDDRPLVLVANHTSWWDGFLLRDVQRALRPHGPMFSVMTESELNRHPFLRLLGAVPLAPGSPASLLRLLRNLHDTTRERPDSTVLFFPQGRMWPAWKRPLGFHDGIELVIGALAPCAVLPVAIHVESLNLVRPTAFIQVGAPLFADGEPIAAAALETAVTSLLDDVAAVLHEHGEAAPEYLMKRTEAV